MKPLAKRYVLLYVGLFLLYVAGNAQERPERWTLRACLDYAMEHNIHTRRI